MKIYATLVYDNSTNSVGVGEVFVNEEDAKNYKAQQEVDNDGMTVTIAPRTPRTAWNG